MKHSYMKLTYTEESCINLNRREQTRRKWNSRIVCSLLMLLHLCTSVQAQHSTRVEEYIDFNLEIANNHLWRGIEVSDGLVMCTTLALHDKNSHFTLGLWNGTNSSGDYKELNFFGEVKAGGWKLALWDTYNFSPGADYNNREFFNYSAHSTGRFLDCILSYSFTEAVPRFPLTLSCSTILFGRDRWKDNQSNRYSCYLSAEYPLFKNDKWCFEAGVGGTFTWASQKGDKSTFYSDRPGLIHLQLRAQRNVKLAKNYAIPLFACAVFNPVMERAFFQIGAQVFSF